VGGKSGHGETAPLLVEGTPDVNMGRAGSVFRQLCLVEGVRAAGLTDGQLLEGYVVRSDEAAFEALVRRHGPMVLGVCRRILKHAHDAEDAFQATFLVLARKAAAIVPREVVGNWLYGVACRIAMKARGLAARRRMRERQAPARPQAERDNPELQDLLALLDRELSLLPAKYRTPIVLCDLEGNTRKQAARLLGWPEGTLSSRLAVGRARLAGRLSRRLGLALPGGALVLALAQGAATACVPRPLIGITVKAATAVAAGKAAAAGAVSCQVAALTEGVLQAMFLSKLKIAMVVLVGLAVVAAGTGWMAAGLPEAGGQEIKDGSKRPREKEDRRNKDDKGAGSRRDEKIGDELDELQELDKKLAQVKDEAVKLTRQRAILEIELAVRALKKSQNEKEDAAALAKIQEALRSFRRNVLKIDDYEKK
jgi:RNA polymerase sigma factor (sigma-70 family)